MEKSNEEKKVDEIIELATSLLNLMHDAGTNENIAQAALGSAWVRLVSAIGMPKAEFKKLLDALLDLYTPLEKTVERKDEEK